MKNIYLIILLVLTTICSSEAQSRLFGERSAFTQYFLTPYVMHPAAAGQNEYSQVMGLYRNTWASFPGSPETFAFGYDGPIGNRIGLGLLGMTDSFAAFSTSKGVLSLSYTIESPTNKIGFGISGEYIQHKLRSSELLNSLVDQNDIEIVNRLDGYSFFDASVGVYGVFDGKLIYGITLPSIISQRISGEGSDPETEIGFVASLGYRMEVEDKDLVFEPSVYVKKLLFVPLHVDINLKADFLGEQLTAGLTGSVGAENRVGFLIGTQLSNFGFHYAYNLSLHEFQQYNNGAHEISLKLRLQPYNRSSPGE